MIKIDKNKALKKWSSILDHLQVTDPVKREWMAEYAECHLINENVAYSTLGNLYGMGDVTAPVIGPDGRYGHVYSYTGSGLPKPSGRVGSGDLATSTLPISMKIAAQTIGLDLVAVKPVTSPRIEVVFLDFKYDKNPQPYGVNSEENPLVFKIRLADDNKTQDFVNKLRNELKRLNIREMISGLDKRMWVFLSGGTFPYDDEVPTNNISGVTNFFGVLEFLGFSRDGLPMFRSYRQHNTAAAGGWMFDQSKNTFKASPSVKEQLEGTNIILSATTGVSGYTLTGVTIELVSALDDHIPGFSSGWSNNRFGMSRLEDEMTYPGTISPDIFTKSIAVKDIEISSSLKRTQIEDIKASTGIDILQKLESVLINELSQTISRDIVEKIKMLAAENRASNTVPTDSNNRSKFDFYVDEYLGTNTPTPGGETYHSIQRKLVAKINYASNFISIDGRIGPAQYLITNITLASVLQDIAGYTISPVNNAKINYSGQLYPMGTIGNIAIYADPYMRADDNRIFLGRKNSPDEPGLLFLPYLMAQSITITSEATWAPRLLIRSRYAVADVGFYPWRQFMEIRVHDPSGVLI